MVRRRCWERGLLLSTLFCVLLSSVLVCAQSKDELARKHFESGAAYLQQSDYESALREFENSYRLSPRPEILLSIATVHERTGRLGDALDVLNRYLEMAPDGQYAETVKLRVENLQKRSEEEERAKEPPAPVESAPEAPHPAVVQGQPAMARDPAPPARPGEPYRLPAYLALGGAGLFAIGATVTGVMANSQYGDLTDSCKPNCTDDQISSAKNLALTSSVLTAVAVVGAGLGVTLWLSASSDSESVTKSMPRVAVSSHGSDVRAQAAWSF
jgi:hypothetical protein